METATDTLTEYYLRNSQGQELGIYTADGDSTWSWYVYGSERLAKIIKAFRFFIENDLNTPIKVNIGSMKSYSDIFHSNDLKTMELTY